MEKTGKESCICLGQKGSHPQKGMTRREFLKTTSALTLGAAIAPSLLRRMAYAQDFAHKVIHVHNPEATHWDFVTGWHGDYVNQNIVDDMMDRGMMALTKTSSLAESWSEIIPNYQVGQKIAIKVNLNNADAYTETDNQIDALMDPVNAVVRGLKSIGVREADIWILDASRPLPDRFVTRCRYLGVQLFDVEGAPGRTLATFDSADPNATVRFQDPLVPAQRITDVLIEADHLIHMPIMKKHGSAGVTLTFKNLFGVLDEHALLHEWIWNGLPHYSPSYNPMVDYFANPHIMGKTRLIVGDGLFGVLGDESRDPERWHTFGDASPNSLFFSVDPVAIDCVMWDLLMAEEAENTDWCDDYLRLAGDGGLGVFEHRDAQGNYSQIDYVRIEPVTAVENERTPVLPQAYQLAQNYPNPFNASTRIEYALPEDVHVTLEVYNSLGQKMATLLNGPQRAGYKRFRWHGMDDRGNILPSGVYLYRIQAGAFLRTMRMVLVR